MRSRQVLDIIETMGPRGTGDITAKGSPVVKIFALTVALLMAASPVACAAKANNGLLRTDQEEHVWAMDGVRHKPRPKPLYPV